MQSSELVKVFPDLIARYLEQASAPTPVAPGPLHEEHPSWSFVNDSVLTVGAISHTHQQLRVTLGLAFDVPYGPEVSHYVNHLNNKELVFGRMFLIGNDESGRGCILMQEIFSCESLSEEFLPSLKNLLLTIATLGGQGSRVAPQIHERFGGRAFNEEDAFFLQMNG